MAEPAQTFKVGDRVVSTSADINGQMGTIKFIGPMAGSKEIWYGIELDNPVGKSDGTSKGTKYFDCKPSHGAFLQESSLIPLEFDFQGGDQDETEATDFTQEGDPSQEEEEPDTSEQASVVSEKAAPEKPKEEKKTTKTAVTTKPGVKAPVVSKVGSKVDPKAAPASTVKKPVTTTATKTATTTKPTTTTTTAATKTPATTATTAATHKTTPSTSKPTTTAPSTTTHTAAPTTSHATAGQNNAAMEDLQREVELLDSEVKILTEELEYKDKHINELTTKNSELAGKLEEMEVSFRKEKEDLQKKLGDLQATKADELKKLDELDSEYKKKFKDAHQQLQEALKEKKELDYQVKKLTKELESHQNSESMIENLILEKDELAERAELAEGELQESKARVKKLEEEVEILQLELEEAVIAGGGGDSGDLKLENMKLKQALEKIYAKYETEKKEDEAKIKSLTEKVESLPKIEEKDKLIKQMTDDLKKKEGVIEDLKYRVDDAAESVEMVETLTEELLKKDDEIIDLRREIMHLKKDLETDEQLVDEQEEYLKMLEKDVMVRDVEITNLKAKIEEHVNTQQESDKNLQKYKERVRSLNEEVQLLKQKAAGGDEKRLFDKIDELSHRQIELVNHIRENHKRELSAQLEMIKANTETIKYSVLISVLPKNLKDKMYVESLSKYIQIVVLKDKINLLMREVKVKYMKDEYHANENIEFISWLRALLFDLADIIFYCDILEFKFYSFDNQEEIENYVLFSKSNVFNQLLAINSIIEQLFVNIKEDTLSVKFNLETLRLVIGKLTANCKEYEDQFAIIPIKLKKLIDQATAQTYELFALGLNKQKKFYKLEKVIARLEEINYKFHKNLILEDGNAEDKHELNLETMISLKYAVESFCDKMRQEKLPEDNELENMESNFEQECSKLVSYQLNTEDEHQAVTLRGPWNQINNSLRSEIEQVSETAINFEKANSQLKEQIRANLQQQNEVKDLNNIKTTLEKRVADLQIKAEKVAMLETEKKRFLEREVHFKEATEKIRQTLENSEKKVRSLEEEVKRLESQPVGSAGPRASQTPGRPAPNSISDSREKIMTSHGDVEEYLNIISKLTDESVSAKGDEIKKRVDNLDKTMPEFAKCMKRFNLNKGRENNQLKLSEDEQSKLTQIVSRVNEVGKRTKLEICQSTVVPLEEFSKKSKFEKQEFVDNYIKNKTETHNKLRYEVMSLSNNIVNFANKVEEQSKFKLFFEPTVIDLIQKRGGPVRNLGNLEVISLQGSSSSDKVKHDNIIMNQFQLQQLRQLII